jgi:hypothetical protein
MYEELTSSSIVVTLVLMPPGTKTQLHYWPYARQQFEGQLSAQA